MTIKIRVEKIQLPNDNYTVHFFTESEVPSERFVDLSRTGLGTSKYKISNLQAHNENASKGHTAVNVDGYIKRVLTDIVTELSGEGLAVETDIEKVKGIFLPIFVTQAPGASINEN
jgi:hypothetical protein